MRTFQIENSTQRVVCRFSECSHVEDSKEGVLEQTLNEEKRGTGRFHSPGGAAIRLDQERTEQALASIERTVSKDMYRKAGTCQSLVLRLETDSVFHQQ